MEVTVAPITYMPSLAKPVVFPPNPRTVTVDAALVPALWVGALEQAADDEAPGVRQCTTHARNIIGCDYQLRPPIIPHGLNISGKPSAL